MNWLDSFLEGLLTAACVGLSVAFLIACAAAILAVVSIPVALVVWLWMAIL